MKVNLLLNGDNPRSGFLNIDPLASPGDPLKTIGNICNLDELVDDAEADELIALDVIDYLPAAEIDNIINNWLKKIRHGGSITIGGVDIREVARALVRQDLDLERANVLLYGLQQSPWQYKKATLTLQKMLSLLESRGLKIIQKRLNLYFYHIKAERP